MAGAADDDAAVVVVASVYFNVFKYFCSSFIMINAVGGLTFNPAEPKDIFYSILIFALHNY